MMLRLGLSVSVPLSVSIQIHSTCIYDFMSTRVFVSTCVVCMLGCTFASTRSYVTLSNGLKIKKKKNPNQKPTYIGL